MLLKSPTTSASLTKRKLFPRIAHRTSCSNIEEARAGIKVIIAGAVAQLTCCGYGGAKNDPSSYRGIVKIAPLVVRDLRSIPSFRCQVECLIATMAIGRKWVHQRCLLAHRLLGRGPGYCDSVSKILRRTRKNRRGYKCSTKTIGIIGGGQLGQMMALQLSTWGTRLSHWDLGS